MCDALGRPEWTPTVHDSLQAWICSKQAPEGLGKRNMRTILVLTPWELWKHRNAVVFDGATPSMEVMISRVRSEGYVWLSVGLLKGNVDPFFGRLEMRVSAED